MVGGGCAIQAWHVFLLDHGGVGEEFELFGQPGAEGVVAPDHPSPDVAQRLVHTVGVEVARAGGLVEVGCVAAGWRWKGKVRCGGKGWVGHEEAVACGGTPVLVEHAGAALRWSGDPPASAGGPVAEESCPL